MTESAENHVKRADRLFEKAMAAHRDGRLDEAIAGYVEALEINPESSRAYNNMGVALRARRLSRRRGELPPRHRD